LKPREDFYSSGHPRPADVLLVIEISDSSLKYDREMKLPIYATARLPEVWIANLLDGALLVYRDPSGRRYKTSLALRHGESLSCLRLPSIQLAVEELLGPSRS